MDWNTLYLQTFLVIDNAISSPYVQAGFIVGVVLLFIIMYGMVRRHYFHLTMKGANTGFLFGMLLTLFIESVLIAITFYGYRTLDIAQGKVQTQEIARMTQIGVAKVSKILGVETHLIDSTPSATSLLEEIPLLSKQEEDKLRSVLCR